MTKVSTISMLSIGQQGYFPGEPLLAVKSNGNYIVVEGNRRLAAVKLLNGDLLPPKENLKVCKKSLMILPINLRSFPASFMKTERMY